MKTKCGYPIPTNLRVFKTHYDYYYGIGKLSQKECIDRSLLVSGVTFVDQVEFNDYVKENQLDTILR
ncbi:hypothetical protein EZV73_16510 [Acidaminobacter sp. JC074]|uniref:hypothetical protein n=1 Tax=Acidaminobacter sp. JC074 TaxID=2530199 RepID=UPI001F101B15|nr:hypothetical protein [Acidaminobacter sp. JC074]MCH4889200.1 hypothetical protein [Acidaminobacter sp. JC074]